MKVNLDGLKEMSAKVVSCTNNTISITKDLIKESNLSKRLVVLFLTLSLMMPAFLLGDWVKSVAAFQKSLTLSLPQVPAQNAAPPVPLIYSSSDSFSAKLALTVLTVNTTVANGFVSVVNSFKTPQLPEGFEMAKPVSPASAFWFSLGDSINSFFGFFTISSSANPLLIPPPPVPAGSTSFDFDGDGKADVARWRSSIGDWEISYSGTSLPASGTLAAGQLAPADYNGDGVTDLASFNNGTWNILMGGQVTQITGFGQSGDVPVSGNYIGNSNADLAVWRPSNGTWYVREVGNSTVTSYQFGQSGDIAVPGNYDGDVYMDYAVFRPNGGVWHIQGSSSGYYYAQWGVASDIPVPTDFDGDGKTDMAVYRGSSGTWYAYKSSTNNGSYLSEIWGNYGDQPVPADYDGDGIADFSVFRPTSGVWHIYNSDAKDYSHYSLGTPLDTAVSSAYVKQIGGQVVSYDMAKTRLSPKNATGGTDLYSRNFGWSSGLVGLPGRAGLDMGFGISYNSLIWTKFTDPATNNSTMYFDVDNSNISPGFRFGFSTIEPVYYETQTGKFSYLMVTPSGARIEFKQIGASDTYETVNSSYTQLKTGGASSPNDPVENIGITVTGTDGTQMKYNWKAGAFRASEIKDRNGNYITIVHDDYGNLQSVTDTLGRVVNVNYDENLYPVSITQTWKNNNGTGSDFTYYWARFQYTAITLNPDFDNNYGVYGPTGGAPVKVLEKIIRADDSATIFEYQQNTFGQVVKVRNMAPDGHELNYVQTNLVTTGTDEPDCPRISQTKTWAENFNGGAETVVNNTIQAGHQIIVPNEPTETATLIQVSMVDHPNGNVKNIYVGESGWKEGLPIAIDDYANGNGLEKMRWSFNKWTQDDTNLGYALNPRVIETKVGDTSNTRRTTMDYYTIPNTNISQWGLVKEVKVYDANQTTVLKRAVSEYELGSAYIDRHIIGLPLEQKLYDKYDALMAKASYAYDEGDFSATGQNISPIRHDTTNFGASFILGRGNATSLMRWDVTDENNSSIAVKSSVKYNTAGAVTSQKDPLDREVSISYTDSFSDGTNRNAFAYPTKLTDPAGNFSEVKYRFDIGANVWAKSPAPQGNSHGKITERIFDDKGRLQKQSLLKDNVEYAYTKYEYPTSQTLAIVKSTVSDTNANGIGDAADEITSESLLDGAGNVRMTRSPMTFNSSGNPATWVGQQVIYDKLGRAIQQTTPTEIDGSWNATGTDLTRGWQSTSREYDWKGRVTREVGLDNVDMYYSYDGCGCAGGEVTTIRGALVDGERRTQKVYADILGRTWKTEVLDYDDNVYTSSITKFDGRDQASWTKQFAGAAPANALNTDSCPVDPAGQPQSCQIASFLYDGHGRLQSSHSPQQDTGTVTTYSYFKDDKPHIMTDGRGATSTYSYNSRGLVERIDYSLPNAANNFPTINANANITPGPDECPNPQNPDCDICIDDPDNPECNEEPPGPYLSSVQFNYDALGNRTSMIDSETGTTSYNYDSLSRITAEHKTMKSGWSIPTQTFDITYTYNLTGQLSSVTDPFGQRIDYGTDKGGKLETITGTPWGASGSGSQPVTNYINDIEYRAWGPVKQINYGNGTQMTQKFDNRLQLEEFKLEKPGETTPWIKKNSN